MVLSAEVSIDQEVIELAAFECIMGIMTPEELKQLLENLGISDDHVDVVRSFLRKIDERPIFGTTSTQIVNGELQRWLEDPLPENFPKGKMHPEIRAKNLPCRPGRRTVDFVLVKYGCPMDPGMVHDMVIPGMRLPDRAEAETWFIMFDVKGVIAILDAPMIEVTTPEKTEVRVLAIRNGPDGRQFHLTERTNTFGVGNSYLWVVEHQE